MSKFKYPPVKRDESIFDEYYGVKVPDPYRWLEDQDAEAVAEFVKEQNAFTKKYIESPLRENVVKTLTKAYNYMKCTTPEKHGDRYFFCKNSGTEEQGIWYMQNSLSAEPKVLINPNKMSEDGSISVYEMLGMFPYVYFSPNGKLVAYGRCYNGNDWIKLHVRDVTTGQDLPEILDQIQFSKLHWSEDNLGFFYARHPNYDRMGGEKGPSKVYYHRVGTSQSEDLLIAEFPDKPDWLLGAVTVSEDGKYLLMFPSVGPLGAQGEMQVYYAKLQQPLPNAAPTIVPLISEFQAEYEYVASDGPILYFKTNKEAPNYRIIGIDLNRPEESSWSILIPEDSHRVLQWAFPVNGDKLVLGYLEDVKSKLEIRHLKDGSFIQNFDHQLGIGTITSYSGKRCHDEFFFKFESFLIPGKIFRVQFVPKETTAKAEVYLNVEAPGVDEEKFVTNQVFFNSKDGTRVPMFVIHKKNYKPSSNSPTFLYGYGFVKWNILPSFSPEKVVFVNNFDGVYAIANIRGGGEYGETWYKGGSVLNKQNTLDDFIGAAEYLVSQKYTTPSKLVINGESSGGFLVGACINQRPELFGAGVTSVATMDMVRFHKLGTMSSAFEADFGAPTDGVKAHFDNLLKLSPLHNVALPKDVKVQYPSFFLATGNHDEIVIPGHSYKFVAELQHTIGKSAKQTNPLLVKISEGGHEAGKSAATHIADFADIFMFLVKALGFKFTN